MNWYLRKQDQTVYGPVTLDALQAWARGGRIQPDDQLSPDRQAWQPAPALADLQMEWLIDLGDGERFGPVHVLALAELVREGSVPADVLVQHVSDGRISQLAAVALPAVLAVPPPIPPPDPELARLRAALQESDARIVELVKQAAAQPDAEAPHLRQALAKAEERIAELETKCQAVAKVEMADGPVDTATLLQSFRELSQNYDRLLGKLNTKSEELAAALASHARASKDLKAQLASAQDNAQKDRRETDAMRVRYVELEQAHVEVVRAYRDLNDRYICLRQQQADNGGPTPPPPAAEKNKIRLV